MTDSAPTEPRRGFRSAWRHRRWRWLLGSVVVSLAGDLLYWVALIAFLAGGISTTDGATWVAVTVIVRLVPYVVVGPLGGAIADRFDRRRLLVGLDLARGGVFATMAAVIALDGPRLAAVALVGASALIGVVYRPALAGATPFLVTEDDLGAANAAEASLTQLSLFVGPALGAALVAVIDPGIVVAVDAATFVVSAALLSRVGSLGGGRRPTPAADEEAPATSLLRDTAQGFSVIARDRGLLALVTLITTVLFVFGAQQVLYVLVARDRLGLGPEGIGVLIAGSGLGGLAIAPFTGRLASSRHLGWLAGGSGVAASAPLALMATVESRPVALGLTAIEGAGAIVFEIALITLLQRAVAEELIGRVYSVQDALSAAGEIAGSVVAPLAVAAAGLSVALGAVGSAGIVVSALTVPALVVLAQRLEARRLALAGVTEWLAGLDQLAGFDPVARERLARSATEVTVPAGEVVLTEGAPPDDLYVVRSGRLAVSSSTATGAIPDLGADDVFGEIGLLRGVPRTATVTAVDDSVLVRIDGRVFVEVALSASAPLDPIAGGMRQRLTRTHPHLALDAMSPQAAPA